MNWLISVPAWGDRYRKSFAERGLPSLLAALDHAKIKNVRFLVHTDKPGFVDVPDPDVTWLAKASDPGSLALGQCVRRAISHAVLGECIATVNSDIVVSREAFQVAERHFGSGKRLIQCHAIRTRDLTPWMPSMSSRDLIDWAWLKRHPWVRECVYGTGQVVQPAIVVFEEGKNVVVHAFSLSTFALRKDRWAMPRDIPTMDDLPTHFASREIHVVTDPDEMAIAEPCGEIPYMTFKRRTLNERVIVKFAPHYATPAMYRQFAHQIVLRGERSEKALTIATNCLAQLNTAHNPIRMVKEN